jgi:hypothetical protein
MIITNEHLFRSCPHFVQVMVMMMVVITMVMIVVVIWCDGDDGG